MALGGDVGLGECMAVLGVIFREDHAAALTGWALHVAAAEKEEVCLLWCEVGGTMGEVEVVEAGSAGVPAGVWEAVGAFRKSVGEFGEVSPEEIEDWPKVEVRRVSAANRFRAVEKVVAEVKPGLLVVGKRVSTRSPEATEAAHLARRLFERAACDTILLRLGGEAGIDVMGGAKVLVPAAGGRNSRLALRLGDELARVVHGTLTPLNVQPNVDDVSVAVGEKLLLSALGRAGVEDAKGDHIELKVVLGDDVDEAIRAEVDEGGYGLVLMGASDVSSVRRKLFGTIPDRVVLEEKSTLAVIRRARPLGERVKERVGRAFDLTVPQLRREERINLFAELEGKSRWSFDFMALICLSTAIASLGLLQNSVAVVIGAMLVAPLMTPLLGAGLALVQGNGPLMRSSVKAIVYGFLMAVVIGVCVGALGKPMTGLTGEMLARGEPSLWDMGVGFLSGVAASYCIARPGLSSALAGVAIAAALVPPIATVGMSLALGEPGNARGAALLFGTNVVAIVLGAAVSFYGAGIRGRKGSGMALWVKRTIFGLAVCLAVLAVPLGSVIVGRVLENQQLRDGRAVSAELRDDIEAVLRIHEPGSVLEKIEVKRALGGRLEVVELRVSGPVGVGEEGFGAVEKAVRAEVGAGVRVRLRTELVRGGE